MGDIDACFNVDKRGALAINCSFSLRVSSNIKSEGKRSMLRLTCCFNFLVSVSYNAARSASIITLYPLNTKISDSMSRVLKACFIIN